MANIITLNKMNKNFFKKLKVLDGGMGQELHANGLVSKGTLWSTSAVLDEKYHQLIINTHLAFVEAGADVIHGTALGVGERAGNAPLDQTLVNLSLMGIINNDLSMLSEYVQKANEYITVPLPRNYPVFGQDAFETGTGVHASAVIKAVSYTHLTLPTIITV